MSIPDELPATLWLPALALAGFLVFRAFRIFGSRRTGLRPASHRRSAQDRVPAPSLTDPLLNACLGDRARADRLTEREIRRSPGISRALARERAFRKLISDRVH